jgi:cellulose 1,4-beta-cellobiosidase
MAIGTGSYSTLETGVTTTTYIAIGLTQGTTYHFKIQSRNIFGYSLDSSSVSILAAQPPDIDWTAPNDRGKAIDSYRISILQSDLVTYSLELNDCDGSKAEIVAATQCVIDVLVLRSAPFSLPWGSSVYAKVIAHNSYGDSVESNPGTGSEGILMTYPDAPTTLTEVISERAADSITFTWVDG